MNDNIEERINLQKALFEIEDSNIFNRLVSWGGEGAEGGGLAGPSSIMGGGGSLRREGELDLWATV